MKRVDALSRVHLRVFELGRVLEDPVEEPFVFAKEQRLLRLAGNVEHAKHEYQDDRDGSQNGHGHVPPGAASGTTKWTGVCGRASQRRATGATGAHTTERRDGGVVTADEQDDGGRVGVCRLNETGAANGA